jgi:hypothetical protein
MAAVPEKIIRYFSCLRGKFVTRRINRIFAADQRIETALSIE